MSPLLNYATLCLLSMFIIMPLPLLIKPTNTTVEHQIVTVVKLSFYLTLPALYIFCFEHTDTIIISSPWFTILAFQVNISLKFDFYSIIFMPIAIFVTLCVINYAFWYLHHDFKLALFMKYLLAFLIAMLILVTSNNMFMMFIGWEGVGIMSFLLIGWWFGRPDANTAAMQAVLYNRIGDVGLVFAMAWFTLNLNSWDLDTIQALSGRLDTTIPLFGLILAATAKSAQFGLHPWLPSAMEGPTPVSALLHSSTMVVAGIFIMLRFSGLTHHAPLILSVCMCLGAITTFFAALCAILQPDLKKIVAYSTCSQLGLMMICIGLDQPQLAFFHMCAHAFFKAMLFLCSGYFIHALNDEQDTRKMGSLATLTPLASAATTIGTLALMGIPFLSGYMSKDPIIEAFATSDFNAWALVLGYLSLTLTVTYSIRLIRFTPSDHPRHLPHWDPMGQATRATRAIKRLAWASVMGGFLIVLFITLPKAPSLTMSPLVKLSALAITFLALIIALQLTDRTISLSKEVPALVSPYHFISLLGFFPSVLHRLAPRLALILSQFMAQKIDQALLDKSTQSMFVHPFLPIISFVVSTKMGTLKVHLSLFVFTLLFVLVYLSL